MSKEVSLNEGGCWFCHRVTDEDMRFSVEFDCWVHPKCMEHGLATGNPEAEIMADEFGIKYVSKFPDYEYYDETTEWTEKNQQEIEVHLEMRGKKDGDDDT